MNRATSFSSLHAGLIERARKPAAPAPGVIPMPLMPVNAGRTADLDRVLPERAFTLGQPLAGHPAAVPPRPRRLGLTVRVEPELRARLDALRAETGETIQGILHRALVRELTIARH